MTISLFNWMTSFYGKFGDALIAREALTNLANFTLGTQTGLTALAGGAQAGSPLLVYGTNEIDTVATANDSVQLPAAIPGGWVTVNNNGASTCRIYAGIAPNINNASALDQIVANATTALTANGTAVTLAAGYVAEFVCATIGIWKRVAAAS